MFVVCVTVWVKSGYEGDFLEATRTNHFAKRKEPGNVRFDVLQMQDDPTQFFLYEVYRSPEDFTACFAGLSISRLRPDPGPLRCKHGCGRKSTPRGVAVVEGLCPTGIYKT